MNAKKILKTAGYLPKWAWYLISFFIGGPIGILVVYLAFHVLGKIAKEQEASAREFHRTGSTYRDEDCTVTSERGAHRDEAYAGFSTMDESADVSEVIRAGRDAMHRIRVANDIIKDEDLSAKIDSIETSCAQILTILEQRPALLPQLRTFLRYYLPTTLKLLDARARLEDSARTPKAREVRSRISEAVSTIDTAFLKQVDALDAYRFIDLESEMDVLRDMLKADGLIDEDGKNDPFARPTGAR